VAPLLLLPALDERFPPLDELADDLLLRASRAVCRAARLSPFSERPPAPEPAPFPALSTRSSLAMFSLPFLRR